eukprot:g1831.t1
MSSSRVVTPEARMSNVYVCAPNTTSKFKEECPAWAGKTPFQDRFIRALQREENGDTQSFATRKKTKLRVLCTKTPIEEEEEIESDKENASPRSAVVSDANLQSRSPARSLSHDFMTSSDGGAKEEEALLPAPVYHDALSALKRRLDSEPYVRKDAFDELEKSVRTKTVAIRSLRTKCKLLEKDCEMLSPEWEEDDPVTWVYEGPLEKHADVLRGLLNPRDALTVYHAIRRSLLGRWHSMTLSRNHDSNSDDPIMVSVSALLKHFGERATTVLTQHLMTGGRKISEFELDSFTVFACRFSLMSPTSIAVLLFRAFASNEEDFISETSMTIGAVHMLLDVLKSCDPSAEEYASQISRHKENHIKREQEHRRESIQLRQLASKRRAGNIFYLVDFRTYLHENPRILQPLMSIQRRCWNVFVGQAFWARVRRDCERRGSVAVAKEAEKQWRFTCKRCKKKFKTRKHLKRHRKGKRCMKAGEKNNNDDDNDDGNISDGGVSSPRSPKTPRKKTKGMIDRQVSAHMQARHIEKESRARRREQNEEREAREIEEEEKLREHAERSYPTEEATSCVICLEDIHLTEALLLGGCGHLFHESCISKWLDNCNTLGTKQTCALCRREWTTKDSSPGLDMAAKHSMYKVPHPNSAGVKMSDIQDDNERDDEVADANDLRPQIEGLGSTLETAWRWRHEITVQATARREGGSFPPSSGAAAATAISRKSVVDDHDDDIWKRFVDTSGAVYWHQPKTARFRWDEKAPAGPWVRYVDAEGKPFLYNTATGSYRWDRSKAVAGPITGAASSREGAPV